MYKVVAIIMDGVTIKGYKLKKAESNETVNIPSNKMIEMVKSDEIDGVSIVEDGGYEFLVGLNMRDLMIESSVNVKLVDKIKDESGNVIGYQVTDNKENEKKISVKKAWNMAANGCIENGNASFSRNADGSVTKYFQMM